MTEIAWWQRGVVYQIYPRSFQDSDGDGIGDLAGVRSRLDYLAWLGIDAIWLSPIYPSPMADFGYDVSDYRDIEPMFGTLAEFDRLVDEAHARDIRVILDFVPNHTSKAHPWFAQSRSSRDNPKRDWYLWRDPAPDGGPPNNWRSAFGGSAWQLDAATGQYYYHAFLKEQPDLNWRNPAVQEAMLDVMRFWLERGVDGFRVDVIWHLIKDDAWRDNPTNPAYDPEQGPYHEHLHTYSSDRPEVHAVISRMRKLVDSYPERVLIGEIYLPIERVIAYYGANGSGVHLPFNFQLLLLPWQAPVIKEAIDNYETTLPENAWPNWVLSNHDKPRVATRVGPAQARVAAMLLLTLRGTPTLYYGDELGMRNVPVPPERVQDPLEKNMPGLGVGRDPQRAPMPWEAGPHAGFSATEPWLPLPDEHRKINVAVQKEDRHSMLNLHRQLVALRRAHPALTVGQYVAHAAEGGMVAFVRQTAAERLLVALNLASVPLIWELPASITPERVLLSTHLDAPSVAGRQLALRADEGVVIALRR